MVSAYTEGAADELPVGGYAVIATSFVASFGALLAVAARRRALPRRLRAGDIVLLGIATHKLTRILTRDWVTIPLRAPFTHYEGSAGSGEVREKSRGRGLRRAIGDLVTCTFCTGPWIAGALTAGLVARPRATRVIAGVLAMVTISDFLHHLYARMKKPSSAG